MSELSFCKTEARDMECARTTVSPFGLLFFPYSFLKSEKNRACGAICGTSGTPSPTAVWVCGKEYGLRSKGRAWFLRATTGRPYGGGIGADGNLRDVEDAVPYGGGNWCGLRFN